MSPHRSTLSPRTLAIPAVALPAVALPTTLVLLLLLLASPATSLHAQGGTSAPGRDTASAASDSARAGTSTTTTGKAAGKRSRLVAVGKAAAAKANQAATKIEDATGAPKGTVTSAALAATGVGAAAAIAKPDSALGQASLGAAVGKSVGKSVVDRLRKGRSGDAGTQLPAAAMGGMDPSSAAQMAALQQQMMAQQALAAQASVVPTSGMGAVEAEYTQLVLRAQGGDQTAVRQLTRFQYELSSAMLGLQSLAPDKQAAAYEAALRQAMACAKSGTGCRARMP